MAPEIAARRLLKSLDVTSPPVDPREVAESLGITVEDANLGQDCSGILVRGSTGAVIGVEISHPELRQRFSVAHELGHFLLHDGSYIDKAISVRYRNLESGSGTKKEEREANLFAGKSVVGCENPADMPQRLNIKRHPIRPEDRPGAGVISRNPKSRILFKEIFVH